MKTIGVFGSTLEIAEKQIEKLRQRYPLGTKLVPILANETSHGQRLDGAFIDCEIEDDYVIEVILPSLRFEGRINYYFYNYPDRAK